MKDGPSHEFLGKSVMTEPDVALTDYGLALECALFAFLIYRQESGYPLRVSLSLFFASTAVASFTGGTVHGFFLDEQTLGYRILWPGTLIFIGVTTVAAWTIGSTILFSPRIARWIFAAAAAEFAVYSLAVLFLTPEFWLAIAAYLPAAIFLLVALSLAYYRRPQERKLLIGILGLALTLAGVFVQQAGIAIHPVYFNHNALYHLIQGVALFMIFLAARELMAGEKT